MHDFSHYAHEALYYLHVIVTFLLDGLREGFSRVNGALLGLVIALFGAYFLHDWRKRIFAITLGATLVYLIAEIMLPVLANGASFRLPPNMLEVSYWRVALASHRPGESSPICGMRCSALPSTPDQACSTSTSPSWG